MASTWGTNSWGDNSWQSNVLSVDVSGFSLSTNIGTVAAFPEQGWGGKTWSAVNDGFFRNTRSL